MPSLVSPNADARRAKDDRRVSNRGWTARRPERSTAGCPAERSAADVCAWAPGLGRCAGGCWHRFRAAGVRLAASAGWAAGCRRQRANLVSRERSPQVRQRPAGLEHDGRLVVDVVQEEHALVERRQQAVRLRAIDRPGRGALEPVEHARLVALGLQPAEEPRPRVGEALVVEVDRILRGEHDARARTRGPA